MYKVAIIGAGAAGIEAAKACIKANLKTVLIDREESSLGGTCLNWGCIPTKFYIRHSQEEELSQLFQNKENLISGIKKPLINYLSKKIDIKFGDSKLIDEHTIGLGSESISAEYIVVASGSQPKEIIPLDGERVVFGEEFFKRNIEGDKFLVVGAGPEGLEMATILASAKKAVTIIEKEDSILPFMLDKDVALRLAGTFKKRGISIVTSANLADYDLASFDKVFVCAGRVPCLDFLESASCAIERDERGYIKTNEYLATSIPHIFACGDVLGGNMLAYTAEYEARLCIENIAGSKKKANYQGLAHCAFSLPQAAQAGAREDELKEQGVAYTVKKVNFLGVSASYVYEDTSGYIKVLLSEKGDTLLGVQIISNYAADLINIFSLCLRENLPLEALKESLFIHPTMAEVASKIFHS